MSSPLMSAFTANARIAPNARRKILPPMPIWPPELVAAAPSRGNTSNRISTPAADSSIRQAEHMTVRPLVLLRHAKAEAPGQLPGFERGVTAEGESDADAAGSWLADEHLRPDLVLCSSARRTRQTWQGVAVAVAQA